MIAFHVDWYCPNCGLTERTGPVVNRFHHCPKLALTAPLLREGVKAKVEVVMREDYAGTDILQRDDSGRAVMNVTTTRDDGQDVIVFAPTATMRGDANGLV
jgi:hypothetical protein